MLLCDIGNSSYHFLDNDKEFKKSVEEFDPSNFDELVYYICVNQKIKNILQELPNWIDISKKIDLSRYYNTMGIDRILAMQTITDGVVVDVGSAITVDVVKDGEFQGGFIYPGIKAMSQTYKAISSALDYSFNFEFDLEVLPKNTQDAISYGYLKTLYSEVYSHNMDIVLTGGDAKKFVKIFRDARVDENLVFSGMKKVIYGNKNEIK